MKQIANVFLSIKKFDWRMALSLMIGVLAFLGVTEAKEGKKDHLDLKKLPRVTADVETVMSRDIRDIIDFGDRTSERDHNVEFQHADIEEISYLSEEQEAQKHEATGRRIAPQEGEKGSITFNIKVSPTEKNYITYRLWGSEESFSRLSLTMQADEELPLGNALGKTSGFPAQEKPFPGRWIYRTVWLPVEATEGRSNIRLRLESSGTAPAIYNIYTHTEPYFPVPSNEHQGKPFEWGPVREKPEGFPTIEDRLKTRVEKDVEYLMNRKQAVLSSSYGQSEAMTRSRMMHGLAAIYHAEWSEYYHDESIPETIRKALDVRVKRQSKLASPGLMSRRGWMPLGFVAKSYAMLHDAFAERGWLDEPVELEKPNGNTYTISRRRAYGDFFHNAFEWRRQDRRHYTNQPVHISTSLERLQEALRQLGDERALSEKQALWYVLEASGLEPLRSYKFGIEGDAAGFPYYTVTPKGTPREKGYTHGYGSTVFELDDKYSLDPGGDRPAFEQLKQQTLKGMKASMYFRYPANDPEGYRTFRRIGCFGWRGARYPGKISYGNISPALVPDNDMAVRLEQLRINHGRFYPGKTPGRSSNHWNVANTIRQYEHYKEFKEIPPVDKPLPIEPGYEDDYVFGDEQVGVYTFRHGDNRVFGTFWYGWPAHRGAVWNYGRLRHIQPDKDRVADVRFESRFPSSGNFLEMQHSWGARKYEKTPTPPPPGLKKWPHEFSEETAARRAGLAYFYRLQYGDYLIGMNTTQKGTYRENTYELEIPENVTKAINIDTGEAVDTDEPFMVKPETTVVLYLTD